MATGGHGVRFQYDYTHDQAGLPGSVSAHRTSLAAADSHRRHDHRLRLQRRNQLAQDRQRGAGRPAERPCTSDCSPPRRRRPKDRRPRPQRRSTTSPSARWPMATLKRPAGPWHGASIGTGPRDFYTTLGNGGYRQARDSIVVTGSGDIAPAVASAGGDTASDSLLFGLVVALIVLIVIATMFITERVPARPDPHDVRRHARSRTRAGRQSRRDRRRRISWSAQSHRPSRSPSASTS